MLNFHDIDFSAAYLASPRSSELTGAGRVYSMVDAFTVSSYHDIDFQGC